MAITKKPKSIFVLLSLLLGLTSISQITSDLYLPSLPDMAKQMGLDVHLVQLTITIYMVGLCLSQLIYGPLSDALGRRRPLLFGLLLNVIGGIICTSSQHLATLYTGRLLQGLGAGAGLVIGRSTMRDLFSSELLAKYSSYMAISGVFVLSTAPILGGYIQHYLGWRYNFVALTSYGLLVLFCFFYLLGETNDHHHINNLAITTMARNCWRLLTSATFLRYSLCALCTYGGLLGWVTATPIILQGTVGLNAVQFGWVYVVSGVGFFLGGLLNARFVVIFKMENMITLGLSLELMAGAMMLIPFMLGFINVWVIIAPIGLYMIGASMVFPNSSAGAFTPFRSISGMAGALFGFLQLLGGSTASGIIAAVHADNQLPVAIAFIVASTLAMIIFKTLKTTAQAQSKEP